MFLENETTAKRADAASGKARPLDNKAKAGAGRRKPGPIPRRAQRSSVPPAFAQQRLWFLDQLHPGNAFYNFPTALRMRGTLDRDALSHALNAIVMRHEALRTRFVSVEGSPVQMVDDPTPVELPIADLAGLPAAVREAEAQRLAVLEAGRPFDLAKGPMLRALLVALGPEEHLLVLTVHHIATDAWSMDVFARELGAFYSARLAARAAELPELPIQYGDFAVWQRDWLQGEVLERQLDYWKQRLAGAPPSLDLPMDRARPAAPRFRGGSHSQALPMRLHDGLKRLSRQEKATTFMAYLAAFQVLLSRYSRQKDILVGSPIAGRTMKETENLIGFFVNTLVMRADLSGEPTFREFLGRVGESAFGAFAHQDLPFEKLVEELHPERNPGQAPLVQVMFAFQSAAAQKPSLPGLQVESVEIGNGAAKFDLTLFLEEREDGPMTIWEYNADLFDGTTIARMAGHFANLLEGIVADPEGRIGRIPLMGEAERRRVLVEWNSTATEYPRERCVQELFEEQAAANPAALAVTFGERHLTYDELNTRANQLAHRLRRAGVKPGTAVAICVERSLEMVTGLLGVLKSGGGYAALETGLPKARLAGILEDLQAPVILTQEKLAPRLREAVEAAAFGDGRKPEVFCLDRDWRELAREETRNPACVTRPGDLAYVCFTSGSTGRPKGVCVPHRGVVRLVRNTNYVNFTAEDVLLQIAPISFDASTFEIWGTLLNGARLVVYPPRALSCAELGKAIVNKGVTIFWVTSGLFNQMAEEKPECLRGVRQVITGGEVLSLSHARKVLAHLGGGSLLNVYGPTENTTFTTYFPIPANFASDAPAPIGRPIANSHCFVVDEYGEPTPTGVPGELVVGGDGLAIGYLNRPELTAEKFIANRFSDDPGARLYRTGDLARWREDGTLEFLGRMDLQVKIRGFRVELEEIESALLAHPAVKECVVTACEEAGGTKRLAAYVAPKGATPGAAELREHLRSLLPDYMVPSAFVFLTRLPLKENGKVDRRALPSPDSSRPDSETKYVEPQDELEREIAALWESVLGVRPIGRDDRFFDLGGHSLMAVRLLAQVEKRFGRTLPVAAVFQRPTVGEMAELLRDRKRLEPGSSVVEIQPKGTRPPLFLVHGVGGGMFWGYTNLARSLGTNQPLYALKSRAMDGEKEFASVEEMAAQYVADVRGVQPEGPYHLGGYCFGGNVAFEMARQLEEQGEKVALLAVMNCAPPNTSYARVDWGAAGTFKFIRNFVYLLTRSLKWGPQQRREFLRWKTAMLRRRVVRMLRLPREVSEQIDVDDLVDLSTFPQDQRELWETHIRALIKFFPKKYGGRVTLFRSKGHPMFCSFDPQYGWGDLTREVKVHVVPGAHESILEEPHVRVLAKLLDGCMETDGGKIQDPRSKIQGSSKIQDPRSDIPPLTNPIPDSVAERGKEIVDMRSGLVEKHYHRPDFSLSEEVQGELEYPGGGELCVHQLFEEQVRRGPEAIAAVLGDRQVSYAELNRRANRLAHHLRALGVGPDVAVGICTGRSLEMVAGVLGILKAGGAYVPLDPAYPRERLALMVENARVKVLVTRRELAGVAPGVEQTICLDEPLPEGLAEDNPDSGVTPKNLAYVIHTSGSTGKPKGVAMEHKPLANLIQWQLGESGMGRGDKTLQFASLSFDVSFQEMFSTWCSGGVLVLVEEEVRRDATRLAELLQRERVGRLFLPFVALHQLAEAVAEGAPAPEALREIVTAGEQLRTTPRIRELFAKLGNCTLCNQYGPSETHVATAFMLAGRPEEWPALPPIGKAIANTQLYLLDEKLSPAAEGEAGELYIGGDCLARGYLHQPQMTAERFVADPFCGEAGARMYKTGDLARRLPDGNLEFLGRADHQVKIRGYRVELGEVEAVLGTHPAVRECAVAAREEDSGAKRLVAYVVRQAGQTVGVPELRKFVAGKLPDYMTPSAWVWLESLPLTPSGKVNRLALPAPDQERPELDESFVAPRNETEEKLAAIWREVLGLKQVGVHDDFFALGGHSLVIARVISRARDALKVELAAASLFERPTIAGLAEGIAAGLWGREKLQIAPALEKRERGSEAPLSFAQRRLWFIDRLEPGSDAYHVPMAIRLRGKLNVVALERSLAEIARRHEVLRARIAVTDGNPVQVIAADAGVVLTRADVQPVEQSGRESEARRIVDEEAQRPFDLELGPLWRCRLVQLGAEDHVLIVVMHHIVSDGWSQSVLLEELNGLYEAFARGGPCTSLPVLPVQYSDYAEWQQQWMQGAVLERELGYWKQSLAGAPAAIELPLDNAEGKAESAACGQETVRLSAELMRSLAQRGREEGVTTFMLLMAALAITMHKWTEQADMVLGTVVAGRNRRETENLIGCFMNFLPLRAHVTPEQSGRDVLARMKRTVLEAQAHQECPFERIVEAVNPQRRLSENPLYNVALLLQNLPARILPSAGALKSDWWRVDSRTALLDLRFVAEESAEGMELTCEYKVGRFEPGTVRQLLAAMERVLGELAAGTGKRVAELGWPKELAAQAASARAREDRQTIAVAATFTAEPLADSLRYWTRELEIPARIEFAPYNQVFQQLLDPTSKLAANARGLNVILLRWEDWERYEGAEVNGNGAGRGDHERLERNLEEFVRAMRVAANRGAMPWLVCICPAGRSAASNPIRGAFYQRAEMRLSTELERIGGVHLVTGKELNRLYGVADYYDPRSEELGQIPYTPAFFAALGTMVARKFHALKRPMFKVIVADCDQTLWAGVCGEDGPKGILLDPPRRALQQFLRSKHDAGMLLCLCSKNNEEEVARVFEQRCEMPLSREHLTAWRINWRPKSENLKSLAKQLRLGLDSFIFIDDNPVECAEVEANCPEVLVLQLPEAPELIPQFLRHCWAFDQLKTSAEDRQRTAMYQQEQRREEFREGTGNLAEFLAGLDLKVNVATMSESQVTRVAQLTQRTNQFNFSTRRRTEGELQALVRGGKHEVLTVSVSDRFGDYGLVGVMICEAAGRALTVDTFLLSCRVLGRGVEHQMLARLGTLALRQGREMIDLHFVPSGVNQPAFNFLDGTVAQHRQSLGGGYVYRVPAESVVGLRWEPPQDAPTREAGADRKETAKEAAAGRRRPKFSRYRQIALEANDPNRILRAIEEQLRPRGGNAGSYVAPRTETEEMLCRLWQSLLRVERVGIRDNFFELGGHSLLAVRLFAEVEKLTGKKLPLVTLFQHSTVEQLALMIEQRSGAVRSSLVAIQAHGTRPPLFLIHGAGGDVLWGYANLAEQLGSEQPVYGIKSRALNGAEEFSRLEDMATYYIGQIRRLQKEGPYYLGGYCFGGNVAYEMARQLVSSGEQVALLAMLDSAPSNCGYEQMRWWRPDFAVKFGINTYYWLDDFLHTTRREQREFIARKLRIWGRKALRKLFGARGEPAQVDLEEVIDLSRFPAHELRLWQLHLNALAAHVSRPYPGKVTLFRTRGQPVFCSLEEDFGWGRLVSGGVDIRLVPGSHESIFMEPAVRQLAEELRACLEEKAEEQKGEQEAIATI